MFQSRLGNCKDMYWEIERKKYINALNYITEKNSNGIFHFAGDKLISNRARCQELAKERLHNDSENDTTDEDMRTENPNEIQQELSHTHTS